MTIHIAPEPDFSYVSFETDVPQENYGQLIQKLIDVFKPGKFMINVLAPSVGAVKQRHRKKQRILESKTAVVVGASNTNLSNGMTSNFETVHGLNLYEELLCTDGTNEFFQADLQMVHYKHCDIIFARYVAEGIS